MGDVKRKIVLIVLIILLNTTLMGCSNDSINDNQEDTTSDRIEYLKLNDLPTPRFLFPRAEYPHILFLKNGTLMMAFSDNEIFVSYSLNGINWTTPNQITKPDPEYLIALYPRIHQLENGTIIITFGKSCGDPNLYAVISLGGTNWSEPYINHEKFEDYKLWNEISPPDFLGETPQVFSSLIKLTNGTYIIARGNNFGSCKVTSDLIISYSRTGEEWTLPIIITESYDASSPSLIQMKDGSFLIVFEGRSIERGILSLTLSFTDLTEASEYPNVN
jgi:hypothetical protein